MVSERHGFESHDGTINFRSWRTRTSRTCSSSEWCAVHASATCRAARDKRTRNKSAYRDAYEGAAQQRGKSVTSWVHRAKILPMYDI